jgi:uncharacterized protein
VVVEGARTLLFLETAPKARLRMQHLYIDISDILNEIGSEKRIERSFDPKVLKSAGEEIFLAKPIELDLVIRNIGDRLLAEGKMKGQIRLECSRCLTGYCADFCIDLKESFCHKCQCEGEEDVLEFAGDRIDVGPAINQSLRLWIPIKNLCTEACKGLCAKCGANLNETECNCAQDEIDPRLEVLKDYFGNQ